MPKGLNSETLGGLQLNITMDDGTYSTEVVFSYEKEAKEKIAKAEDLGDANSAFCFVVPRSKNADAPWWGSRVYKLKDGTKLVNSVSRFETNPQGKVVYIDFVDPSKQRSHAFVLVPTKGTRDMVKELVPEIPPNNPLLLGFAEENKGTGTVQYKLVDGRTAILSILRIYNDVTNKSAFAFTCLKDVATGEWIKETLPQEVDGQRIEYNEMQAKIFGTVLPAITDPYIDEAKQAEIMKAFLASL